MAQWETFKEKVLVELVVIHRVLTSSLTAFVLNECFGASVI